MVGEVVKRPIVAVSGFFDPLHEGHLDYIDAASQYGDVHVYLNSDDAAFRKKGYVFMPFRQRARILMALKGVTLVIPAEDDDGTVCKTLQMFKPNFFAKGGDRHIENTPEVELCNQLGIGLLFNIGGSKYESSSELVRKAMSHVNKGTPLQTDWGK